MKKPLLSIGTRSVLYGAHCFFLHPFFVAWAWCELYGFPWDPRIWVAFLVHDLGYVGKPNMDGNEGERHPELGAWIMSTLFDRRKAFKDVDAIPLVRPGGRTRWVGKWGQLTLFHSRYYASRCAAQVSQLCFADKLSFCLTPRWLYLPMVRATGELGEYLDQAQVCDSEHCTPTGTPTGRDARRWHAQLSAYMRRWVDEHKDKGIDTWSHSRNFENEG